MTVEALSHRCYHHQARAAVCQCPGCSRPFCRECVTEHESRLLCAACLAIRTLPAEAHPATGRLRLLAPAVAVVSFVLIWLCFLAVGTLVIETGARLEEQRWQTP